MSVSYYALVVRELDGEALTWFAVRGLPFPDLLTPGEFPTAEQMVAQVQSVGGFHADWEKDRRLTVVDSRTFEVTSLEIRDEGLHEFYFHRGDVGAVVSVCLALSPLTGPLLLCDDFGSALVVYPDMGSAEWRLLA